MKENLEETLENQEEAVNQSAAVVDNVDSAPILLCYRELDVPRDFIVGP